MSRRDTLRLVHFASTGWFILCVGCILVLTLRQAGFRWWVIFSVSGHSALLVFLLISLYLFAIFRGIDRGRKSKIEHPLTSTSYYAAFYDTTPFLGAVAGALGMVGCGSFVELLVGIVMGTLGTTFLVWIIVDPVTGFVERLLPSGRAHRLARLAETRAERQERERQRKRLLDEVFAREQQDKLRWQQVLRPWAEELVSLSAAQAAGVGKAEDKVLSIGAKAWQMGGIGCMKLLHSMAMEISGERHQDSMIIDYISLWWDGVGSWRSGSLV